MNESAQSCQARQIGERERKTRLYNHIRPLRIIHVERERGKYD